MNEWFHFRSFRIDNSGRKFMALVLNTHLGTKASFKLNENPLGNFTVGDEMIKLLLGLRINNVTGK